MDVVGMWEGQQQRIGRGRNSLMEVVVGLGLLNGAGAEPVERRQANPFRCQTDLKLNPGLQLGDLGQIICELSSFLLFMGMRVLL